MKKHSELKDKICLEENIWCNVLTARISSREVCTLIFIRNMSACEGGILRVCDFILDRECEA